MIVEKQLRRSGGGLYSSGVTASSGSEVNCTGAGVVGSRVAGGSNIGRFNKSSVSEPSSSRLKCFKCGEPGHQQSECKKVEKRTIFAYENQEEMESLFLIRSMQTKSI